MPPDWRQPAKYENCSALELAAQVAVNIEKQAQKSRALLKNEVVPVNQKLSSSVSWIRIPAMHGYCVLMYDFTQRLPELPEATGPGDICISIPTERYTIYLYG